MRHEGQPLRGHQQQQKGETGKSPRDNTAIAWPRVQVIPAPPSPIPPTLLKHVRRPSRLSVPNAPCPHPIPLAPCENPRGCGYRTTTPRKPTGAERRGATQVDNGTTDFGTEHELRGRWGGSPCVSRAAPWAPCAVCGDGGRGMRRPGAGVFSPRPRGRGRRPSRPFLAVPGPRRPLAQLGVLPPSQPLPPLPSPPALCSSASLDSWVGRGKAN